MFDGAKLRDLRTQNGLTQKALADAIGISQGSVANYEKGLRVPPSDVAEKLTAYFDVASDFFGSTDDRPSQRKRAASPASFAPPTTAADIAEAVAALAVAGCSIRVDERDGGKAVQLQFPPMQEGAPLFGTVCAIGSIADLADPGYVGIDVNALLNTYLESRIPELRAIPVDNAWGE